MNIKLDYNYIKLFVVGILIFNVLLLACCLFPSEILKENIRESADLLSKEGNYYKFKGVDISNNNYTDALILNMIYSIDNKTPYQSYMLGRKNYDDTITNRTVEMNIGEAKSMKPDNEDVKFAKNYDAVGELSDFLDGKINVAMKYERYWHGWLIIYRVLMIFFNIAEIRWLLFIVFTLLFVLLIYKLLKEFGFFVALFFEYSLIVYGYFYTSYSLESAPIFILMMLTSLMLLKYKDNINIVKSMFITGMLANYFDFLTVPLISLVIPMYVYILFLNKQKVDSKVMIKKVACSVIMWGIGYALTWICKFFLCELFVQKGSFVNAIKQVLYRTTRSSPNTSESLFGTLCKLVIKANLYLCVIFMFIGMILLSGKFKIILTKENRAYAIMIFTLALFPFVWYFILANHTISHTVFVYRHMIIFLLGVLISGYSLLKIEKV